MTAARILVSSKPADPKKWHKGPPPFIGWWNASVYRDAGAWRWWNGSCWSTVVYNCDTALTAGRRAGTVVNDPPRAVEWRTYYPAGARVKRVMP